MKKLLIILLFPMAVVAQKKQEINLIIPNDRLEVAKFKTIKDGKYIILATKTRKIQIWEAASGKLIKEFKEAYGTDFAIAPDGNTVGLIANSQASILLFDFDKFIVIDSVKKTFESDSVGISEIAFAPNGKEIYAGVFKIIDPVLGLYEYAIWTINIKSNSAKKLSDCKERMNIDLSPDGNWLLHYSGVESSGNILYNTKTGDELNANNFRGFTKDSKLYKLDYDKTDPTYKTYTAVVFNPNTNTNDIQFNLSYQSQEMGNYKNDVWLDENQLLISYEHDFSIINFKEKKATPLTRYNDELIAKSMILNFVVAKKENGIAKTLYRFAEKPINQMVEWDLQENKIIRKIGISINCGFSPAVAENNFKFQIDKKEIQLGKRINSYIYNTEVDQVIAYSHDGDIRLHTGTASNLEKFKSLDEAGNPTQVKEYDETQFNIQPQGLAYSSDNTLVATIAQDVIYILKTETLEKVSEFKTGGPNYSTSSKSLGCFIDNNQKLIAQASSSDGEKYTYCIDAKTGAVLWKIKKELIAFTPTPDGIVCLEILYNLNRWSELRNFVYNIYWLNPKTGETIKTQEIDIALGILDACFTKDGKQLIFASGSNVCFYDVIKKELKKVYQRNTSRYTNVSFFQHNPNFAISFDNDGNIVFWDAIKKIELAKLFFYDKEEWVCITPDGRFDASPNAMKEIYYTKGKEIIALENLYEKYYTPQLIARIIAKEVFDAVPDINNLKIKPVVKMLYEQKIRNLNVEDDKPGFVNTTGLAEITINATAPDDAIDEIRLFHNGKIVNLATRGLFVTDAGSATESIKYSINLLPGQNTFRAVALNSQRTESKPDEIEVLYKNANEPVIEKPANKTDGVIVDEVDKNATLYLIVVGINQYQNKTMSLNYALADATSFKEEVEKDAKSVIGTVKTYFVTDNTANKAGISNAFKEVQQNAKPQDVFIFYYAGHGVIGKNKEFYLVPTDVSDLKNVQTELEQKGIPSKMLQQYAIDIQAQKQLFILDACQSAGAFETLMSNDGNQQKSLAVVARSTGTHWMAASGAMQYANEFSSLGHGVFTYVLLQALKGEAEKNKLITVNGLKNFLQTGVPALMKKYNGTEQYPASYGLGNDFPVEVIK